MRLIAVPTDLEREKLERALGARGRDDLVRELEVVGFGPVASGVGTSRRLAGSSVSSVIHVGICGTFDPERFPIGSAMEIDAVELDGVGVGALPDHRRASDLQFPQLDAIGDRIELTENPTALTLTVCAASASDEEAELRRHRFPAAIAEDMESYAVALACRATLPDRIVPLSIVRGASNVVGNRRIGEWCMDDAIDAIATRLDESGPRG